jgi:hypothetical protein
MSGSVAPFDSEAAYRAAIDLTIAGAGRELRVFDRDLVAMAFEHRARIDLLNTFLAAGRDRKLVVILHDSSPLQARMPRLLNLMRNYAHQVDVRITPDHLRNLADCWLLADQENGVIRFHADHTRGKCVVASAGEIKPWWQRADDLLAEGESVTPWAVAGL